MDEQKILIEEQIKNLNSADFEGPIFDVISKFQNMVTDFQVAGYSQIRISYDYNPDSGYYTVKGKRIETDKELKQRIERQEHDKKIENIKKLKKEKKDKETLEKLIKKYGVPSR